MRKAQTREALELIASLHQAHEEIKEALRKKEYGPAQNMLGECQEFAVALGEMIERTEGEGHSTVAHIENYCETLFQVFQETGSGQVNEKKLGCSLGELVRRVNEEGVKFGIWIEPEMISEDSGLYREHPDWAMQNPGRNPARGRNQLVLDFSREEVREHIFDQICRVLDQGNIEYI